MITDKNLCKIVHVEEVQGQKIFANLTRFGGLFVAVYDGKGEYRFSCENILEAREWVLKNVIEDEAERFEDRANEASYYAQFG